MNAEQVRQYVLRYLEATACQIIEVTATSITVHLSEQADRRLTNRPYYWGFIDRTGTEPQTMKFTFQFDSAATSSTLPLQPSSSSTAPTASDCMFQHYFDVAPAFTGGAGKNGYIPCAQITFGSQRLAQMMQAAHDEGRFSNMFVVPTNQQLKNSANDFIAYEPWLLCNVKVSFACDLKREEIHSYGISLVTSTIQTDFMEHISPFPLSPTLPPRMYIMPWKMTIEQARSEIEKHFLAIISRADTKWATAASLRLEEELTQLTSYYEPLLQHHSESNMLREDNTDHQAEYEKKCQDIRCQFEPRIQVSLLNAALIHLSPTIC